MAETQTKELSKSESDREREGDRRGEEDMPKWMSFKLFKESSRVSTNCWITHCSLAAHTLY